ncbi:MAG TPA: hypothetical protein EYN06_08050 [Myxococcales bacterium]|nr:hypothetical protein [Myxococcales bacterium]HIN86418.1 hypothetical protein [Myxococcales bacterium]
MIRIALVAGLLIAAQPAHAENETATLSTASTVPVGINLAKKWFVAINQDTKDAVTRYWPAAYRGLRWKKVRTRFRAFSLDATDETTLTESMTRTAKVRQIVDEALAGNNIAVVTPIAGGFTGRYRIPDLNAVVYINKKQLLVRTGDTLVPKKKVLVENLHSLIRGRCTGRIESKILHAAYQSDWKSVAAFIEVTCTPDDEKGTFRRARRLVAVNLSKI